MSDLKTFVPRRLARFKEPNAPTFVADASTGHIFRNSAAGGGGRLYVCEEPANPQKWSSTDGAKPVTSPEHASLTAYYTMDNISGTVLVDESAIGNDGTTVNGPSSVPGVIDNALEFDGIDQRVNCPSSVFLGGEYTVSIKIKPKTFSQVSRFLGVEQTGAQVKLYAEVSTGSAIVVVAATGPGTTTVVGSFGPITTSDFYHLAIRGNDTSCEAILDFVSIGSSGLVDTSATTIDVHLGAGPDGGTYANVAMDQVRFFNQQKSDPAVAELFLEGQ